MAKTRAVLDADFINKINEIRQADKERLFEKLMDELDCLPFVHPYVMEHELFGCELAASMRGKGALCCMNYDVFMPAGKKARYEQRFRDLYRQMTLQENGWEAEAHDDIFARHAGCSYGEIHSVLMAAELGIPIFYSNDHSGKSLCGRFRGLKAKTMWELREEFRGREGCAISAREWRLLCHRN